MNWLEYLQGIFHYNAKLGFKIMSIFCFDFATLKSFHPFK